MSLFRNILAYSAGKIPSKGLCNSVKPVIIHPFYHTVSDEYLPHIHPLYTPKNRLEFMKDIDFFSRYFEPVNIDTVYSSVTQGTFPSKNAFHISFDDGLRNVYEIIFPLLYQKGIPATIFINTAFIDNKDLFYRHKTALLIDKLKGKKTSQVVKSEIRNILSINYLQRESLDKIAVLLEIDFQEFLKNHRPYLTTDELKEMKEKGFTIGSHSIDHPRYTEIDEMEQIRQTVESCQYVKEAFQESHAYFSFPFSDDKIPDSFFKSVGSHTDLTFGISGMKTRNQGKHIGRIDMEKRKNREEIIHPLLLKYKILKLIS
jgi:peptidoglycan/xylan/chitin deacetylase (PgdA/CDA1 family)